MEIKILGTGCSKCKKLEANTKEAAKQLNEDVQIIKVEDIKEIMKYGVMSTPAIVINKNVKMFGKVCTVDEIKKYINDEK